mmetsp:Transcript_23328/g.46524  ORF Transcript_23328/g.46524 Transcript_23328/m.46524 type:complete len:431 (+) Transcript_23328:145-1437(+)
MKCLVLSFASTILATSPTGAFALDVDTTGSRVAINNRSLKKSKSKKFKSSVTSSPTSTCDTLENGSEVYISTPNEEVELKQEAVIDTATCEYKISISFKVNEEYTFLSNDFENFELEPGDDQNLFGMDPAKHARLCNREGRLEDGGPDIYWEREGLDNPFPPDHVPVLSAQNHVGLNKYFKDYSFKNEFSKKTLKKTGYQTVTLGGSPCGTVTPPFPQYSVHFYSKSIDFLNSMTCVSGGGFFCKPQTEQCSESGRKFNLDGEGLPKCKDAPLGGPPVYQNVPRGTIWTTDGNPANGISIGTPGMGLHGANFGDDHFVNDQRIPVNFMLNYDKEVIGNHILIWGGWAKGLGKPDANEYVNEIPEYNCPTADKSYLANKSIVEFDHASKRTTISIAGPLKDCSGVSYREVLDYTKKGKQAKKGKKGKKGKY